MKLKTASKVNIANENLKRSQNQDANLESELSLFSFSKKLVRKLMMLIFIDFSKPVS